ncbi:dihydrofolate reductase family protein [Alkalicoccus halolimnae]|uniref:Dihydrofolate reductase family protein n=1 Tax=Alkalicoccus halolimnae TaxID=1667239 RepID=A0A5C7F030_9BACI|nr:dihydrofolate reductase family protein [Alkalicoccus halolimnae]TXF82327.1 dihydrofolate reductase [Alkalicoccus halolimnae]
MKREVYLFIAMSLDGYIATKEESLEWLFRNEGKEDNGYEKFLEKIDKIVMGRKTFDWVMKETKGEFPYKDMDCYVFTRKAKDPAGNITFVQDDPADYIKKLAEEGNVWVVGGGKLILPLLEKRVIDEIQIAVAPVLLGDGIPLFQKGAYEMDLELLGVRQFDHFAEMRYRFKSK